MTRPMSLHLTQILKRSPTNSCLRANHYGRETLSHHKKGLKMNTQDKKMQKANKFLAKVTKMTLKEKRIARSAVDTLDYFMLDDKYRESYIGSIRKFDPKLADKMNYFLAKVHLLSVIGIQGYSYQDISSSLESDHKHDVFEDDDVSNIPF